jgi:hypothetical protein
MALFDNLLTIFILLTLALIIYLKVTHKTLPDFFREIREIMQDSQEEVTQPIQ